VMSSEGRAAKRDATRRLDVLASYITLSSVTYYATVTALLHVLRTDFDPGYRYLSEYARGPYGVVMISTFFVLSAGSLALSLGLYRSVASRLRFLPGLVLWLTCVRCFPGGHLYLRPARDTAHSNWPDP